MANSVAVERVEAPGLGVDALDVGLRGLGRDAQGAGDLPGGCAAGDEGEHLDLARGEPGRAGAPFGPALPGGGEHGVDRVGGQPARPDLFAQFVSGLLGRAGPAGTAGARSWHGRRRRRPGSGR